MKFGKALKDMRQQNNLSQSELAKRTGISQQNISSWESEQKIPSIEFIVRLADFYCVSVDELIGREIPLN